MVHRHSVPGTGLALSLCTETLAVPDIRNKKKKKTRKNRNSNKEKEKADEEKEAAHADSLGLKTLKSWPIATSEKIVLLHSTRQQCSSNFSIFHFVCLQNLIYLRSINDV